MNAYEALGSGHATSADPSADATGMHTDTGDDAYIHDIHGQGHADMHTGRDDTYIHDMHDDAYIHDKHDDAYIHDIHGHGGTPGMDIDDLMGRLGSMSAAYDDEDP
jgi:hypothetical protein